MELIVIAITQAVPQHAGNANGAIQVPRDEQPDNVPEVGFYRQ